MSDASQNQTRPPPRRRRIRRAFAFRCGAVLVGLLPLLLLEVGFRLLGWGMISEVRDPFVGFQQVSNLFELDSAAERYAIAKSRLGFFRPDSFAAEKAANEYRVFCLGGSTVQGRPYAIETSFTSWLELSLTAADTSRRWRVVNCGGVSYASYRLVPILREVLDYQPDLIIVYSGHNEFLEDRTYDQVKRVPALLQSTHRWMSKLRVYNAGRGLLRRWSGKSQSLDQLAGEVETRLDYWGGLDKFKRDPDWRRAVVNHYEHNLRRMVELCRAKRIPLILVNPVSNLKDAAPFKYQHGDITPDQRQEFQRLWDEARNGQLSLDERIERLEAAVAIDRQHAAAVFHLGKCYEAVNRWNEAGQCFASALEEDICPLRMIAALHDALRRVAGQTNTPLVRVVDRFEAKSPAGLLGREVFVDHVHPTIQGHQWIAAALFQQLVSQGVVSEPDGTQTRRQDLYLKHYQTLEPMYFVRGKERLEGLRIWTKGQVPKYK